MKLEILYTRTARPRGQVPAARTALLRAGWQRVHPARAFPAGGMPLPGQGPWQLPALAFSFSLSHADGLSVLACAQQGRVGVDLAHAHDAALAQQLDDSFFTPAEQRALARQRYTPLQLWTRKEAVLKAAGCGLLLDSSQADVAGPSCRVQGITYLLHSNGFLADYELALATELVHGQPAPVAYTEVFLEASLL